MNILTEELPVCVEVGGRRCPIHTAFHVWVRFELAMQDADLSDTDKVRTALELCYPTVPADLGAALDALLWFYRCGEDSPKEGKGSGGAHHKKAYCFEQDADYIYAAFLSCYGIDLTDSDMHWWKFRALFRALPQECEWSRSWATARRTSRECPRRRRSSTRRCGNSMPSRTVAA